MNCREFEDRLNNVLDDRGQPAADEPLVAHLRQCAQCRSLLAHWQAIHACLERMPLEQPSEEFTERVLAEVSILRVPGIRRRRLAWAAAAAGMGSGEWAVGRIRRRRLAWAAAAAVVAIATASIIHTWPGGHAGNRQVSNMEDSRERQPPPALRAKAKPARPLTRVSPIRSVARDATSGYRDLAQETRQSLVAALRIVPRAGLLVPGLEPTVAPANAVLPEGATGLLKVQEQARKAQARWANGIANGLSPLTRSTSGALESFYKVIAVGPEDSRT